MANPQAYAVNNGWLGIAPEVTPGTPVNPTIYVPLKNPDWVPKVVYLLDDSLIGSPVMYRDVMTGVIYYEFNMKSFLFADIFPYLMVNLLGGTDAVTGTVAPYTHTIGVVNNTTGSQPTTFTVTWFDGHAVQQVAGCMLSKLEIQSKIDAAVECSINFIGATVTNPSLSGNSYNSEHLMPAWDTTMLIGTVQSFAVEDYTLTIDRASKPIFGHGQQGPRLVFSGPIKVSGKYLCFYDSGDALAPNITADALTRDLLALPVTFNDPVTSHSIKFQMSAVQLMNPTEPADKEYLGAAADFEAIGNSTDATSGGISPIKVIVNNAQSAAA